jgi:hypothetical protein
VAKGHDRYVVDLAVASVTLPPAAARDAADHMRPPGPQRQQSRRPPPDSLATLRDPARPISQGGRVERRGLYPLAFNGNHLDPTSAAPVRQYPRARCCRGDRHPNVCARASVCAATHVTAPEEPQSSGRRLKTTHAPGADRSLVTASTRPCHQAERRARVSAHVSVAGIVRRVSARAAAKHCWPQKIRFQSSFHVPVALSRDSVSPKKRGAPHN